MSIEVLASNDLPSRPRPSKSKRPFPSDYAVYSSSPLSRDPVPSLPHDSDDHPRFTNQHTSENGFAGHLRMDDDPHGRRLPLPPPQPAAPPPPSNSSPSISHSANSTPSSVSQPLYPGHPPPSHRELHAPRSPTSPRVKRQRSDVTLPSLPPPSTSPYLPSSASSSGPRMTWQGQDERPYGGSGHPHPGRYDLAEPSVPSVREAGDAYLPLPRLPPHPRPPRPPYVHGYDAEPQRPAMMNRHEWTAGGGGGGPPPPPSWSSAAPGAEGGAHVYASTEAGPSNWQTSSSPPPPPGAGAAGQPQKKKRTRQLMTPTQSRVLHDLLAQTKFPSTAVREQVAKELGLSPRKVQVFFQNKRQKARKKALLEQQAAMSATQGRHPFAQGAFTFSTSPPAPALPPQRPPPGADATGEPRPPNWSSPAYPAPPHVPSEHHRRPLPPSDSPSIGSSSADEKDAPPPFYPGRPPPPPVARPPSIAYDVVPYDVPGGPRQEPPPHAPHLPPSDPSAHRVMPGPVPLPQPAESRQARSPASSGRAPPAPLVIPPVSSTSSVPRLPSPLSASSSPSIEAAIQGQQPLRQARSAHFHPYPPPPSRKSSLNQTGGPLPSPSEIAFTPTPTAGAFPPPSVLNAGPRTRSSSTASNFSTLSSTYAGSAGSSVRALRGVGSSGSISSTSVLTPRSSMESSLAYAGRPRADTLGDADADEGAAPPFIHLPPLEGLSRRARGYSDVGGGDPFGSVKGLGLSFGRGAERPRSGSGSGSGSSASRLGLDHRLSLNRPSLPSIRSLTIDEGDSSPESQSGELGAGAGAGAGASATASVALPPVSALQAPLERSAERSVRESRPTPRRYTFGSPEPPETGFSLPPLQTSRSRVPPPPLPPPRYPGSPTRAPSMPALASRLDDDGGPGPARSAASQQRAVSVEELQRGARSTPPTVVSPSSRRTDGEDGRTDGLPSIVSEHESRRRRASPKPMTAEAAEEMEGEDGEAALGPRTTSSSSSSSWGASSSQALTPRAARQKALSDPSKLAMGGLSISPPLRGSVDDGGGKARRPSPSPSLSPSPSPSPSPSSQ